MAGYLLDTTVLIDALRGRPAADRLQGLQATGSVPWVSVINIEEVVRGVRAEEERVTLSLLRALRLAPIGHEEAELAGRWRREHAAGGSTLSQADCLIAAAAVGVGAILATGNPSDFPMPELVVEHWPVGG